MRTGLALWFLIAGIAVQAQQIADGVYWVYFKDKLNNGAEVGQPGDFLSQRSIDRRAWQGLSIDLTDEPVTPAYLEEVRSMGIEIKHVSRWLNGFVMINATMDQYREVLEKPFTDSIPWVPGSDETYRPPKPSGNRFDPPLPVSPDYDYGIAREQVEQVETDVLHRNGFTGAGVWIAVLDAGFRNVDTLSAFRNMIDENRLLGTRNFVNDSSVFRLVNSHGMYVLSIIGAGWDGYIVGTAPGASFFLASSENVHQETRIEEIAWVEAAEYVDSLGYDVINTSLGYSDFDGTLYDYTYEDMDGRTTFISRAASMLADKGILASNSAGNEGGSSWYHITAPSDADGILCVGAVDSTGRIAGFSSRGPAADSRVKPDVVAMGSGTGVQYVNGNLARGGGTSFSSPVIAGSVASLWQAHPEVPARELIGWIRQSADRNESPGETYGFGLPNFARASWLINSVRNPSITEKLRIRPNPVHDLLHIELPGNQSGDYRLTLYDMSGRIVGIRSAQLPGEVRLPGEPEPGMYLLEAGNDRQQYRNRIIIH